MAPRRGEEEGREEGQRRGWAGLLLLSGEQRGSGCGGLPGWAERGYRERRRGGMGQGCGRYGCDAGDRVAGMLEAARTTSGVIAKAVAVSQSEV